MSFALMIGAFTWTELQVNQSLEDVDQLYFVESVSKNNNGNPLFTSAPLLREAMDLYPGVIENYFRFWDRNVTLSNGDTHLRIQSMIGDSSFVKIFGFHVISGDVNNTLSRPNTIVITEKVAMQFFGRPDVAGENLILAREGGGTKNLEITAVIATPEKKNSVTDLVNMDAQAFLPLKNASDFSFGEPDLNQWPLTIISYVRLARGADPVEVEKLLNILQRKSLQVDAAQMPTLALKPLSDYYRLTNRGAVQTLLITLNIVVAFIILLAVANFINITITGSFSRLKEIGLRKVVGGVTRQVMMQFLSESLIFSVCSALLALALYQLLLTQAESLLNTTMPSIFEFPLSFWMLITGAVILIGLIAGAYPAWYLSKTNTLESLKGKFRSVKGTINFSRGLIAIQFTISVVILTAAVIMSKQIKYFLEKDLGFDKNAVLVITSAPRMWTPEGYERLEVAKREFLQSPAIAAMALSTGSPTGQFSMGGGVAFQSGKSISEGSAATITGTDEDYIKVYGMKMVEGVYFEAPGKNAPNSIVINETLQKNLEVGIGDKLKFDTFANSEFTIVGIVQDFNVSSLREAVQPIAILHSRDFLTFRHYSLKLQPGDLAEAVAEVERLWKKTFPDEALVYAFADKQIEQLYKTELQMNKAAKVASILMMIIVMTGVLGLVALSVARRRKEIGIRKVLGASVESILKLLSREYVLMMIFAFLAGIPFSYWFISNWLSTFAYHIDLTAALFAIPAATLMVVTLMMVCLQGMRAALMDPVKSIRHE